MAALLGGACSSSDPGEPSPGSSGSDGAAADTAASGDGAATPDDALPPDAAGGDTTSPLGPLPGTAVLWDLSGPLDQPAHFFDAPFPSDLRRGADGRPDLRGWPNPDAVPLVDALIAGAADRQDFSPLPVVWFRFDGAVAPQSGDAARVPGPDAPILLVDLVDGRRYPVVARTLVPDTYTPDNVLAVAPWPGFVLMPGRPHAAIVLRSLGTPSGAPLGVPSGVRQVVRGADERAAWAPLLAWLATPGAPALDDIAAVTVFSTGDVVADLSALSDAVLADHDATISDLHIDPEDGAAHPRFCELHGTLTLPQFQRGEPPFGTEGLFEIGADGVLVLQRTESVPMVLSLPKVPMPAGGWPLVLYFHGSGGLSTQVVDRGTIVDGEPTPGEGPAHVLAAHGFAAAGSALPVNPERVPGAWDFEYLNFANLRAFRDTFRQGAIEQRLYLEALGRLAIPPALVAACGLPALPPGEPAYRLNTGRVAVQGQSMGAQYAAMVGAIEPRVEVAVPTGGGAFWSSQILSTEVLDARPLVKGLLGTEVELSFLHPAMHALELAWEAAETLIYMPRLGARPLSGHPARHVYQPVGKGDTNFSLDIFDAVALAFDHQQAGTEAWPSMQSSLTLAGLGGLLPYPVHLNRPSATGGRFTGVVVQYEGDGVTDPHYIFQQLDAVKYQYGCFIASWWRDGTATLAAPAPLGTPCP